jgi:hypothetical protein
LFANNNRHTLAAREISIFVVLKEMKDPTYIVLVFCSTLVGLRATAQMNEGTVGVVTAPLVAFQTNSPCLYPDAIDHAAMVNRLIALSRMEGSVYRDLRDCRLVSSAALVFQAAVTTNSTPLVFEQCLVWAEMERQGQVEWLLVAFYRHPYGPRKTHAEWRVSSMAGHFHSPIALKVYTTRPMEKDIVDFQSVFHSESIQRLFGCRFIADERFDDSWAKAVGPKKKKATAQPEPDRDGLKPAP